jgi:hypothetical protein
MWKSAPVLRLREVGEKVCIKPNAFGNALGNSLAESSRPQETAPEKTFAQDMAERKTGSFFEQWKANTSNSTETNASAPEVPNADSEEGIFLTPAEREAMQKESEAEVQRINNNLAAKVKARMDRQLEQKQRELLSNLTRSIGIGSNGDSNAETVIYVDTSPGRASQGRADANAGWRIGDKPGAFVAQERDLIADPPSGTSNYATEELKTKYASKLRGLVAQGTGSTIFGDGHADGFINNDFGITPYPEEAKIRVSDPTRHKYGVLSYVGSVDEARGINLSFLENEVLVKRFSFPSRGILPVQANFSGKSDVYAVAPWSVLGRSDASQEQTLANPANYDYKIGVIEQVKVPNGVVNITTEDHNVYPGTIRRTALEFEGQLFIYTSGAGVNRMNNSGDGPGPLFIPLVGPAIVGIRATAQNAAAKGNDQFGPMAFRTLDQQAFKFIQSKRGR